MINNPKTLMPTVLFASDSYCKHKLEKQPDFVSCFEKNILKTLFKLEQHGFPLCLEVDSNNDTNKEVIAVLNNETTGYSQITPKDFTRLASNPEYITVTKNSDKSFEITFPNSEKKTIKAWDELYLTLVNTAKVAAIKRVTKETSVNLSVNLLSNANSKVSSSIGFLDHMFQQLITHGGIGINLEATGDNYVDNHHIVEDIGICFGQAVLNALGNKSGINRYGSASRPLDEALANVAIDFAGRSHLHWDVKLSTDYLGQFPTDMVSHFFESFCSNSRSTLHIKAYGENDHHIVESIFKAFSGALAHAVAPSATSNILSTKGVL